MISPIEGMRMIMGNASDAYRKVLIDGDKKATGATISSLNYKLSISGYSITGELYGSKAIQFIRSGRRPGAKLPPQGSLLDWMRSRSIPAKAEFPIRRAIAKKGIKPFDVDGRAAILFEAKNKKIAEEVSKNLIVETLKQRLIA